MKVQYIDLGAQHAPLKKEILARIEALLDNGQYILGDEVKQFEQSFAALCGTKYAVGMGNGTDTLTLIMKGAGIGPGDEVITPPNSYLASTSSIALAGATPVFADVREDYNIDPIEIERKITPRTKAIMVVHLTGRPADMDVLVPLAQKHNLLIIEDAAQAVGASYKGQSVGSFGIAGSFSLHPLKNLSACGDGGMVTTNDENLYKWLLLARNHGHSSRDTCEFWSLNTRLDNLQAAILNVKIKELEGWNNRRREIAAMYQEHLKECPIYIPNDTDKERAVYHTFIIQTDKRDALQKYLADADIETKIHYPIPIHLQHAAKSIGAKPGDYPRTERQCATILSLPIYPQLTNEQVLYVCEKINTFFKH